MPEVGPNAGRKCMHIRPRRAPAAPRPDRAGPQSPKPAVLTRAVAAHEPIAAFRPPCGRPVLFYRGRHAVRLPPCCSLSLRCPLDDAAAWLPVDPGWHDLLAGVLRGQPALLPRHERSGNVRGVHERLTQLRVLRQQLLRRALRRGHVRRGRCGPAACRWRTAARRRPLPRRRRLAHVPWRCRELQRLHRTDGWRRRSHRSELHELRRLRPSV